MSIQYRYTVRRDSVAGTWKFTVYHNYPEFAQLIRAVRPCRTLHHTQVVVHAKPADLPEIEQYLTLAGWRRHTIKEATDECYSLRA